MLRRSSVKGKPDLLFGLHQHEVPALLQVPLPRLSINHMLNLRTLVIKIVGKDKASVVSVGNWNNAVLGAEVWRREAATHA